MLMGDEAAKHGRALGILESSRTDQGMRLVKATNRHAPHMKPQPSTYGESRAMGRVQ